MKEIFSDIINSEEENIELAIIRKIKNGDTASFRFLVLNHQESIYSIIFRQVGDKEISEDLTQETFIKAFKGIGSFREEAKFSTWLTRIAINTTRNYFKSRYYKENTKTDLLEPGSNSFESLSKQNSDTIDKEAIERINTLAKGLSLKLRETFVLCALEQKSYKEASSILSIPVGTVRSRLNKARSIIKDKYFSEE